MRTTTYTRDDTQLPGAGQLVKPLVANIAYTALQQPKSWNWQHCSSGIANCVQANRTFDADGRMTSNEFASYSYDPASRITGITQQLAASRRVFVSGTSGPMTTVYFNSPVSWTVSYDNRDRITSFARNSSLLSRASTATPTTQWQRAATTGAFFTRRRCLDACSLSHQTG